MNTILRTTFAFCLIFVMVSFHPIRTQIVVTVLDEVGNPVEGAKVTLYETEEDYTKEVNPAAEGITEIKGVIRIKDLKPISYYVIVRKGDKDNSGGGEQTGKLEGNRINKVTIIIQ